MAPRNDVPAEWSDTDTPAYFSYKHGQLVAHGLGLFDPADPEESLANYKPFLADGLSEPRKAVYCKVVQWPNGYNSNAVDPIRAYHYNVGWFSWVTADEDGHTGLCGREFISFREQVFVAPAPGITNFTFEGEGGAQFLFVPFELNP